MRASGLLRADVALFLELSPPEALSGSVFYFLVVFYQKFSFTYY